MARQYHFEFPTEEAARRFSCLVVWNLREDIAIYRLGCQVSVIDAGERKEQMLELALRVDSRREH